MAIDIINLKKTRRHFGALISKEFEDAESRIALLEDTAGEVVFLSQYTGTDDAKLDALLADLEDGDTAVIPAGAYTFLTQHTIREINGLTLLISRGATLTAGDAAWGTSDSFRAVLRFFDCNDLTIEGGTFVGNSADNDGSGDFSLIFVGTEASDPTNADINSERVTLRGVKFTDVASVGLFCRHVNRVRLEGCTFSRSNPEEDNPLVSILGGQGHRVRDCHFDGGLEDGTYDGNDILQDAAGLIISLSNPYSLYDPGPNTIRAWYVTATFTGAGAASSSQVVNLTNAGVFAGTGTGNWNDTDPEIQFDKDEMLVHCMVDPAAGLEVGPDRLAISSIDHANKSMTFALTDVNGTALNFGTQKYHFAAHRPSGYVRDVVVEGCTFRRTAGVGVFLWHTRQVHLQGNWCEDCLDIGLDVENSHDVDVIGNSVSRTSGVSWCNTGLAAVYGCRNVRFIGNTVDGRGGTLESAIHITNNGTMMADITVEGNTIYGGEIRVVAVDDDSVSLRDGCLSGLLVTKNTVSAVVAGGAQTAQYNIDLDGDNNAFFADITIDGNRLIAARDHAISAKNVFGLSVTKNRISSARFRSILYEPAASARFQNVRVWDNLVRDPNSNQGALVTQQSTPGSNRETALVWGNYQLIEGTTETLRAQYRITSTDTPAEGPPFWQVGTLWLRDNAGTLEYSADTTTGADGNWTAFADA